MVVWSRVSISQVLQSNRLDAEYFTPDVLRVLSLVARKNATTLGDICKVLTGRTPPEYTDGGTLQVVRSGDLISPFIAHDLDLPLLRTVPFSGAFALKKGDVLISSIGFGSIGKISVVFECNDLLTVSEVTVLRESTLSPSYLFAYLRSNVGQTLINREITGATGQQHLLKSKVKEILVPKPSVKVERRVDHYITRAWDLYRGSIKTYSQAESLLLAELGLDRIDLSPSLYHGAQYSETVKAGRLDAEYFQPKYARLLGLIEQTGQSISLGDYLQEPPRRGIQPDYVDEGDIIVINSQHVGKNGVILDGNRRTDRSFLEAKGRKGQVKQYDVLLNSTGYITIGRAQTLLEDVEAIVDSHVTILRPKQLLDPVYLGVFLNSPAGVLQTERNWTGSSGQIELRKEAIAGFRVWLAPGSVQRRIRECVEKAHAARKESKRLIDEAVRLVEETILGTG